MTAVSVRAAVERALGEGCFFVAPPHRLRIERVAAEQVSWEVFRGHLLDPAHTRQTAELEVWSVFLDDGDTAAEAPLVSIKWDAARDVIHVTRQILTHVFEGYEDSPGVILSRPAQKWVAELVGTIDLACFPPDALPLELGTYLLLAIVGTSRLPITSLESPLPAFSLGQLAYVPQLADAPDAWTDAVAFFGAALDAGHVDVHGAKALETALRAISADDVPKLTGIVVEHVASNPLAVDQIGSLVRTLFNSVSLSPYTQFANRLNGLLSELATEPRVGSAVVVDAYGYMLRHLCRHLTAFDLSVFHNFGANYPDALFLDGLLKVYLRLIGEHEDLFIDRPGEADSTAGAKRLRRRALRQACLVRRQYEGHRVPDAPTSMGENLRVLPAPFVRVPQEQILQAGKRRRTLFENEPLDGLLNEPGRRVLVHSVADLETTPELRELGMAHFLDRPLGIFKQPGEVDRTPLLSYEAFSRSIVRNRLAQLQTVGLISPAERERYERRVGEMPLAGLPACRVSAVERPGVVSLADAHRVAGDFVFLRTTRQSFRELVAQHDWQPLEASSPEVGAWLSSGEPILWVQNVPEEASIVQRTLRVYDQKGEPRLELAAAIGPGGTEYVERGGVERLRMRVLRVWESAGGGLAKPRDLGQEPLWLEVR